MSYNVNLVRNTTVFVWVLQSLGGDGSVRDGRKQKKHTVWKVKEIESCRQIKGGIASFCER